MNTEEKIEKIKELGNENLIILSDFDDTITKAFREDNSRASNSFSVYPNHPHLLSEDYVKETNELFDIYYPIEQDPNKSFEEKEKIVVKWWEKEFELYKKYGFTENTIHEIIEKKLLELKEKTPEFFDITKENNIPLVIVSAGIYNIIHSFLDSVKKDYENIHVIANQFEFDADNKFKNIKGDTIHSMNKNFNELKTLPIYDEIKDKKSCIILGDSTSDTQMSNGKEFEVILKIGFLNKLKNDKQYAERLEAHKKYYDIIIEGTEDFTKINDLLKEILN